MAIALYPFIIATKSEKDQPVLMNHEGIHLKQEKELLLVFFILAYFGNIFFNLVRYLSLEKAYKLSIFELEAYAHQDDLEYLKTRKLFTYLRKSKKMKAYKKLILRQPRTKLDTFNALLLIVSFSIFGVVLAKVVFTLLCN